MRADYRILYMEDDEDLGELISGMLRKKGFIVEWAKDGRAGLSLFNTLPFDICVADIMMPKLDGYSLIKAIRTSGSRIPLIVLSARILTEDVLKSFELGADDYMRKPFSVEELIGRIMLQLRKPQNDTAIRSTVEIGSYQYRHESFELRKGRTVSYLSPRAGELLYRLATSENRVLIKKDTLIELWGDDTFFNGRSLDVFISKLRRQLDGDKSIRIINIRGQGYKLVIESP